MSISLTWAKFALIVIPFLFVYYSAVLFFFRKTVEKNEPFLTPVNALFTSDSSSESDNIADRSFSLFGEQTEQNELHTETTFALKADEQEFVNEIEAYTSANGTTVSKKELITNLSNIIRKHQSIFNAGAHYELNQLIAMVSENNCSIHLSEDELDGLWNG